MMFTHYIPWANQKNLSGYYNDRLEDAPTDWVVFSDRDTYFPHPHYGAHLEEILRANHDYTIITCMTNRVGNPMQCVDRMWEVNEEIAHQTMARELWHKHHTKVKNVTDLQPISGMFLAVHKRILTRRIPEPMLLGADNELVYLARANGQTVGLAMGLYLFHSYRLGNRHDKAHLE